MVCPHLNEGEKPMTWLPSSAVRERYRGIKHDKISFRTIDRWVERGILPKPVRIGTRRYWSSEQLDQYDQARLAVAQTDGEAA